MNEIERALQDTPWGSDLAYIQIRKQHPDWEFASDAAPIQQMSARGWRLRAIFRNPCFPPNWAGDGVGDPYPHLFYGPPTESERVGAQVSRRTTTWR
jgi:hypothetical protein